MNDVKKSNCLFYVLFIGEHERLMIYLSMDLNAYLLVVRTDDFSTEVN